VSDAPAEITGLLERMSGGEPGAEGLLFDLVYRELHAEARRQMRGQREGHTLRSTALVHEAYLRLARLDGMRWENRRHFLGVAARAMRSVLVDHARKKAAVKRGEAERTVPLDAVVVVYEERSGDLLALNAALDKLGADDPVAASLVELRFFGGLSVADAARTLEVPKRTAERCWTFARAWLRKELE